MIVKTTYIAIDGTEFQHNWECIEYEDRIQANKFKDTALLFDVAGEPLALTEEGFESAWFIWCKTDEAAEYLSDAFGEWYNPWTDTSCSGLQAGFWYYDGGSDCWQNVNKVIKLADLIKSIMEK